MLFEGSVCEQCCISSLTCFCNRLCCCVGVVILMDMSAIVAEFQSVMVDVLDWFHPSSPESSVFLTLLVILLGFSLLAGLLRVSG